MEFSRERRWSFVDDSDPEGPREFFFYINEKCCFFSFVIYRLVIYRATFPSFPGPTQRGYSDRDLDEHFEDVKYIETT